MSTFLRKINPARIKELMILPKLRLRHPGLVSIHGQQNDPNIKPTSIASSGEDDINIQPSIEQYSPWPKLHRYFSRFVGVLVFVARLPLVAAAAQYDDNSTNNLFSDLAPLLALFGEQVAKQFMSQSMGWADNIIFAMAPLGIITAIVSAIRVGGPVWLRAIIGRARESEAAAEVELLSSTSLDVCELWNGQAIVRMMGSPPVLELIYFPTLRHLDCCGLFTLKEGIDKGIFEPSKQKNVPGLITQTKFLPNSPTDSENSSNPSTAAPSLQNGSPNIFLNLRPKPTGWKEWELWIFAGFSVVLQAGVLAFCGIITYYLRYKKQAKTVGNYAYPLTAAGTLLIVVGMLICSYVVERRTEEVTWNIDFERVQKLKEEGDVNGDNGIVIEPEPNQLGVRILWLQQSGEVNDQQFNSYAIFAQDERNSVLTSRLADHSDTAQLPTNWLARIYAHVHKQLVPISTSGSNSSSNSPASGFSHFLVCKGALVSVSGVIIQFTGLRAMHWVASIAQLVATIIMMVVRAWVRRGLARRPISQITPSGHELDWLASRISRKPNRLWSERNTATVDSFWDEKCENWEIRTGGHVDTKDYVFDKATLRNDVHEVIRVRDRISRLSKWTTPALDPAVSLANAIDVVMNTLFGSVKGNRLFWSVNGSSGGANMEQIRLSIRKIDNRWEADAGEIEAVLSMWLYSIQSINQDQAALLRRNRTKSQKFSSDRESTRRDWLRHGDAALRKPAIRLLGYITEDSDSYLRDLRWYLGSSFDAIKTITEVSQTEDRNEHIETSKIVEIERNRVFGFHQRGSLSANVGSTPSYTEKLIMGEPPPPPNEIQILESEETEAEAVAVAEANTQPPFHRDQEVTRDPGYTLAVLSDEPLMNLLSQDLFSSFMWAVAKKMEPLDGKTTIRAASAQSSGLNWHLFGLENTTLSKMTKEIERVAGERLGTLDDMNFNIIPPLSVHQKLPIAFCILEHARYISKHHETVNHWEEATKVYTWLFQTCTKSSSTSRLSIQATADIFAFSNRVDETEKMWVEQQRDTDTIKTINHIKSYLQKMKRHNKLFESLQDLEKISTEDITPLRIYNNPSQLHKYIADFNQENVLNYFQRADLDAQDQLGLTPLHYAVIYQNERVVNGLLKRNVIRSIPDILGWTPLHYAVAQNKDRIVELLLSSSSGASQNESQSEDLYGCTPLHYVKSEPTAWILLQEGAQLESQDRGGMSALHRAVQNGNVEIANLFLEGGSSVDVLDNTRKTPLHWAACSNNPSMINLLVEKGARIAARDDLGRTVLHLAAVTGVLDSDMLASLKLALNDELLAAKDRMGMTSLHLATTAGNTQSVLALLKHKAEIDIRSRKGCTSLHYAAQNGHEATAKVLLENGADVNATDSGRCTPLHCAAQNGHDATAKLLLENGADVDAKSRGEMFGSVMIGGGRTPLHFAAENGHEATAKVHLENGADVNATDSGRCTPLHCAAQNGHEATAKLLLENGADVDAKSGGGKVGSVVTGGGRTPLHFAAQNGHEATAKVLLENGADVNANHGGAMFKSGCTPLHFAAKNGHEATAKLLLENGADVNVTDSRGRTPLHFAAQNGHEATAKVLLENGADVNTTRLDGYTPLHFAAENGHEATAKLLLENGADIKATDSDGCTPLHFAAENSHEATAKLLLENGADVNVTDSRGCTPLQWAAHNGHEATAKVLLENGADVNTTILDGDTPLHFAAENGHEATAKLLLENGADVNVTNSRGCTPLHWASHNGHEATAKVLLENGADVNATDSGGCTPLDYAAQNGQEAMVYQLQDHCTTRNQQ